jgi:uncharacterized Zn-binding protein involved in type VI secretion
LIASLGAVLIGGLAAASRPICTRACFRLPHPPTPLPNGSTTVFIGGRPALRMGDLSGCGAPIIAGAPTVLIGG